MSLFSIVIPTYNRAHLIGETLDSVLDQGGGDQQVIVVDDGSEDETQEVLASYGGKITVIRQKNRGLAAARNAGIEKASNPYIAFIDSDDLWFPWTLTTYREAIIRADYPAFVSCNMLAFSNKNIVDSIQKADLRVEVFRDYFASSKKFRAPAPSAAVIRTDVLKNVCGFFNQRLYCEDLDMWMRLGVEMGFVKVHSPICGARRIHQNNMVNNVKKIAQGLNYLIQQEKLNKYPGGDDRRLERLRIVTRHVRPFTLKCLQQGFNCDGWKLYVSSVLWNIKLKRIKYLLGYPIFYVAYSSLRHLKTKAGWIGR